MIYLLYGENDYLKKDHLKKIKKEFGELIQGLNYIKITESNLENLSSELITPPFGYDKKIIEIINSNILTKKSNYKEDLIKIFEDIDTDSIEVIFLEENVEKTSLYEFIQKNGKVHECKILSNSELAKKVIQICKMYKVNIDLNLANYIIEQVGTDFNLILNEIRKIIEYTGEGNSVKKEDIDELLIKTPDAVIFDLTNNIGKSNQKEIFKIYKELVYQGNPPQVLLLTLYRHLKKLLIAKKSNANNIFFNLKLKENQRFLVKKYMDQIRNYSEEELIKIIKELILLDEKSKIGDIDINIGLESILCTYLIK